MHDVLSCVFPLTCLLPYAKRCQVLYKKQSCLNFCEYLGRLVYDFLDFCRYLGRFVFDLLTPLLEKEARLQKTQSDVYTIP